MLMAMAMPNPQSINRPQTSSKKIASRTPIGQSFLVESVVATTPGADIGSDAGETHTI